MKKPDRKLSVMRLSLKVETLRPLTQREMASVVGGETPTGKCTGTCGVLQGGVIDIIKSL